MKRRRDAPLRALVSRVRPAHALNFLQAFANVRDDQSQARLVERFPLFMPERSPRAKAPPFNEWLARAIRVAWRERSVTGKELSFSLALAQAHEVYATSMAAPWLARTIIAFSIAQRVADRLRYCKRKGCPAPYFVGKRKYCSPDCALAARRARKLEWWTRNKDEQLKERKRKRREARKPMSFTAGAVAKIAAKNRPGDLAR